MDEWEGEMGKNYDLAATVFTGYFQYQDQIGLWTRKAIDSFGYHVNVVEAGCGNGNTTMRIFSHPKIMKYFAIDKSEEMIKQAKARFFGATDKIEFINKDIVRFLQSAPDFDVFVTAATLHNFPKEKWQRALRWVYKKINRPGTIIIGDKLAYDLPHVHQDDYEWQLKQFDKFTEHGRPDLKEKWTRHYERDEKNKTTEKELISFLKDLGCNRVDPRYRGRLDAIVVASVID